MNTNSGIKPPFYCSEHGENGKPDCKECWQVLFRVLENHNCRIIATNEDIKKYKIPERLRLD